MWIFISIFNKFLELFGEVAYELDSRVLSHFSALFADTHNSILMELVKKVSHRGSTAPDSIAIRSDQKSYTYHQLIESAKNISNLLSSADLKSVSSNIFCQPQSLCRLWILVK